MLVGRPTCSQNKLQQNKYTVKDVNAVKITFENILKQLLFHISLGKKWYTSNYFANYLVSLLNLYLTVFLLYVILKLLKALELSKCYFTYINDVINFQEQY